MGVGNAAIQGIMVQAYSPLGGDDAGTILHDPTLQRVAAAHNRSTAQVALRWVLQQGFALATSTVRRDYMEEDLAVWGWALTEAEMISLTGLAISDDDPVKSMCLP